MRALSWSQLGTARCSPRASDLYIIIEGVVEDREDTLMCWDGVGERRGQHAQHARIRTAAHARPMYGQV